MISIFEAITNNKVDTLYLTESIRTGWPQILDEYFNEGDA